MGKKVLTILGIILLTFYIAFLFVIPNLVNLNKYKDDIIAEVEKTVDLKLKADSIKLYTTPLFKVGIRADNVHLAYENGTELANLDGVDIRLKLLPLIFFKVEFDSVHADDPDFNLLLKNDGSTDLEAFINAQIEKQASDAKPENEKKTEEQDNSFPLKFSTKLPNIKVENYTFKVFDEKNKKTIAVKGSSFTAKGNIEKNIQLKTDGEVQADGKKFVGYKLAVDTFVPAFEEDEDKEQKTQEPVKIDLTPLSKIIDYKFKSDIDADLKIRQHEKHTTIDGYANVTGVEFLVKNNLIKGTELKTVFEKDKVNGQGVVYFPNNEKIDLNADINNGKKPYAKISVLSSKLGLNNAFDTVLVLLDIANLKIGAEDFNVSGSLTSDLSLNVDAKNLTATGKLLLENGSITHKQIPVNIAGTTLALDVSDNNLSIKGDSKVNGENVSLTGKIDSKANTHLILRTDVLPLDILYKAFAPNDLKAVYDLQSGKLAVSADIKGTLSALKPKFDVNLTNLKVYDKSSKMSVTSDKILTNIDTDLKTYKGKLQINNSGIVIPQVIALKSPQVLMDFDTNNIVINNSMLTFNTSPIVFSGLIKDYASDMSININASGAIQASDIKTLLPKELLPYVVTSGAIPAKAKITGNDKNILISAQVLADGGNHFSMLKINELKNSQSLANLKISTDFNNLRIDDISLSKNAVKSSLSDNFDGNLAGAQRLLTISGDIANITAKNPQIKNIDILLPKPISAEIPTLDNSYLSVSGSLNVTGALSAPKIGGNLTIPEVKLPTLLTNAKDLSLVLKSNALNLNCQNLNINDSVFKGTLNVKSIFDPIITITDMNVASTTFDADKMFVFLDKLYAYLAKVMPPSSSGGASSANALVVPATIEKGKAVIDYFSFKPISASAITSDFSLHKDIFYLKNLQATAYEGKIKGNVDYNLKTLFAKCDFEGQGINVTPFVTDFTGLKDQIRGTGKFTAKVTFSGADYNTQMKTLKGTVDFEVVDGQYGNLGKFENFLNAPNLSSITGFAQSFLSATQKLSPQNTGQFDTLTGHIDLADGYASLNPVKSTGKTMSLYITGKFNLLTNVLQADVYGNIRKEIVDTLGPVGNISFSNIIGKAGSFGQKASSLLNTYNQVVTKQSLNKIPALSSEASTKPFLVLLNGNINNPAAVVKSFKWLATDTEMSSAQSGLETVLQGVTTTTNPANAKEILNEAGKNILNSVIPKPVTTTTAETKQKVEETKQKVEETKQTVQQQTNTVKQSVEGFKQQSTAEKVNSIFNVINTVGTQQQKQGTPSDAAD